MVIKYWAGIWIIAGIGFTSVLWNRTMRSRWGFITGITLFSFLTICPGFYFRNHYFVTMLPVVALLAGITTSSLMHMIQNEEWCACKGDSTSDGRCSPHLPDRSVPRIFFHCRSGAGQPDDVWN